MADSATWSGYPFTYLLVDHLKDEANTFPYRP
jgi:hypothetical protein